MWRRPVIVVRRSTERPEVIGTFAHLCEPGHGLVREALALYAAKEFTIAQLAQLPSPYGDEHAAQRCLDALDQLVENRCV